MATTSKYCGCCWYRFDKNKLEYSATETTRSIDRIARWESWFNTWFIVTFANIFRKFARRGGQPSGLWVDEGSQENLIWVLRKKVGWGNEQCIVHDKAAFEVDCGRELSWTSVQPGSDWSPCSFHSTFHIASEVDSKQRTPQRISTSPCAGDQISCGRAYCKGNQVYEKFKMAKGRSSTLFCSICRTDLADSRIQNRLFCV